MKKLKKIVIIGVGLIGGSIGLAVKRIVPRVQVIGIGRRRKSIDKALRLGAIDKGTLDWQKGVKDADMVIVAVPAGKIIDWARKVAGLIKKDCLITDVASTKQKIVTEIEKSSIFFAGSHPLAGSEKRGVGSAKAELFEGAVCFLTKTRKTSPGALKRLNNFWRALGAKTVVISPEAHDRLVAFTSHLPHLASAALMNVIPPDLLQFTGRGFKDTTRIARSGPELWADICLTNSKQILYSLDKFEKELAKFKKAMLSESKVRLEKIFEEAKKKRDKV